MNNKPTIIFDFDGTLVDTLEIFKNIYNGIAPMYGAKQIHGSDIDRLRDGGDTKKLFKEFGISYLKLPRILKEVRRQFKMNLGSVAFHPGVKEMIMTLQAADYTIGILSFNTEEAVREILVRHQLDHAFDFIYSNNKIFKKHHNLKQIMRAHTIAKEDLIYVGDETRDMKSATILGVSSIGVGWGFQTARVLKEANATTVLDDPARIVEAITSCQS